MTILGIPVSLLAGQLAVGLINGSFYALLSLGLAIIFGLLNVINFAHGAFFMMGAFCAWLLAQYLGIGYWPSLILVPVVVGIVGLALELVLIRRVRDLDHLYGFLLTFGLAMVIEGLVRNYFGSSGHSYSVPAELRGSTNLGFMIMPTYRLWVIGVAAVVCFSAWYIIEKTPLGASLRAATENPDLVQAFGIRVPRLLAVTYAAGVALAGFAGVLAAPIYSVSPSMGSSYIIIVFAVVVIGGMGSILGAIVAGFALGLIEGLTKVFYPEAATTIIFVVMAIVLLVRPAGLLGKS